MKTLYQYITERFISKNKDDFEELIYKYCAPMADNNKDTKGGVKSTIKSWLKFENVNQLDGPFIYSEIEDLDFYKDVLDAFKENKLDSSNIKHYSDKDPKFSVHNFNDNNIRYEYSEAEERKSNLGDYISVDATSDIFRIFWKLGAENVQIYFAKK